jgi:mannose-6-phosphate isomerase-like protein (cupin superfamily)
MNHHYPYDYFDRLEDYCLGLMRDEEAKAMTAEANRNPGLLSAIEETEQALSSLNAQQPADKIKNVLLEKLPFLTAEDINLKALPLLNRHSDLTAWKKAVASLQPTSRLGDLETNFIKYTPEVQVCVAWLKGSLKEEGHHEDDFQESFLILEGSCRCNINGQVFNLKAGDFLDIPFDAEHTISSTEPAGGFVKAIIQRIKRAA